MRRAAQSSAASAPGPDAPAPILDEDEQATIVEDFRLQNYRSNAFFRRFMTGLTAVLVVIYLVLIASYYATLESELAEIDDEERARRAGWVVPVSNALAVLGLLASIAYLHRSPGAAIGRTWLSAAALGAVAVGPAAFWAANYARASEDLGAFVLFPFVPALVFVAVVCAVSDFDQCERAVEQLHASMYKAKSV